MKGLILIYVITAIATLVSLRRPKLGLYVYVGFAVLRPQSIWGYAGNIDRVSFILALALLGGWALSGFGSWRFGRGRTVVVALFAFLAWNAFSALQAPNSSLAIGALTEIVKIVLPFLVGVTMMEDENDVRAMLWTIVVAQGYVGFEMNLDYMVKGYNTASEGFGGMDNNCFGVSLVTVVGLAVALALSSKKLWQRGIAVTSAALILHTTLLTYSRGAMIGLLAVGAAAIAIMPKRPKYFIPVLLVAVVALRFTGPELAARYATTFASSDERDGSAESRLDLWKDCMNVVASAPVFGVGPWNWRVVAASYGWAPGKSAHSVWMETAAETGVPGVLALLTFFLSAGIGVWPIARAPLTATNGDEKLLAAGIMMSILGFAVSGQFVSVTGLEAPYYVAMCAVVMLKTERPAIAGVAAPGRASAPPLGPRRLPVASARSARA